MILGRVIGTVTATAKHQSYVGRKLMVVQPILPNGDAKGSSLLAIDNAQAGVGDTVLVLAEGTGIRQICGETQFPIQKMIVATVDSVDVSAPHPRLAPDKAPDKRNHKSGTQN